jgi:hypothetical protein
MYSTLVRRAPLPHIQNELSPSFLQLEASPVRAPQNEFLAQVARLPACQLASLPETDLSSSASVRAASKRSIFGEAKLRTMIADRLLGARPKRAQDLSLPLLPDRASRNRTASLPRTSSCKSEALGIDNGYFIFDRSQHEARMGVDVGHRRSPG